MQHFRPFSFSSVTISPSEVYHLCIIKGLCTVLYAVYWFFLHFVCHVHKNKLLITNPKSLHNDSYQNIKIKIIGSAKLATNWKLKIFGGFRTVTKHRWDAETQLAARLYLNNYWLPSRHQIKVNSRLWLINCKPRAWTRTPELLEKQYPDRLHCQTAYQHYVS